MKTLNEIARGGFGIVERVRLDDGRVVARKTFAPLMHLPDDELSKLRKRFQREVRIQAALKSHHVMPILEADLNGDNPWFLMPIAERTLSQEIEGSKVSGSPPVAALEDLLNALEEMHEAGLVHRDLKPSNALRHEDAWKLSDFGLVLPQTGSTTKLTTASAWGTPEYSAPEQAIDFHGVGPAADIYAFGCILHDIFGSGLRIPYGRHSADGPIGAIIEKCTDSNPARRFKSIAALRGALVTLLSQKVTAQVSANASTWASALEVVDTWTAEKVADFARTLVRLDAFADEYTIYRAIDDDVLRSIHKTNAEAWKVIACAYCEWAEGGFDFSYCDVVVQRLEVIFDLGDLETKAYAAAATAELGASHNRWHVMWKLLRMCGHDAEASIANRIALEVRAREAQPAFCKCVDRIGRQIDAYHPLIAGVLEESLS
jgi:eukaryotic-like serine/threonine-protein kinase